MDQGNFNQKRHNSMNIKRTDFYFSCYDIYLGAEKFDKGDVLEASEEEGVIIYTPKPISSVWGSSSSQKPKREFGKVYIVKVR